MNKKPIVSIIFPNYNGGKEPLECLESISRLNYSKDKIEIIIIDNNSKDGSLENIKKQKAKIKNIKFTIIENKENVGFPKAINQGIKKSTGDYIFIGNDDLIFEKNSIKSMIDYITKNKKIGVLGGKIFSKQNKKQVVSNGYMFDKWTGNIYRSKVDNKISHPDWIQGCAMLVPKYIFGEIGLLDENYSLIYFEDLDFCFRVRKKGYSIVFNPQSSFYHGESTSVNKNVSLKYFYWYKNKILFCLKNLSFLQSTIILLNMFFIVMPYRAIVLQDKRYLPFLKGLLWNITNIFPLYLSNNSKIALGIVIIGIVTRIIGVIIFPINFDEAFNILIPRADTVSSMILGVVDAHPPLYFLISRVWQTISKDIIFIRFLSMIFGIATILSVIYFGKKLVSSSISLIAAFLMAVSPSHIYYSSVARMYSLAILESFFILYFFTWFLKKRSNTLPLLIFFILGIYTHYYFVLLYIMLTLYVLIHKSRKDYLKQWIGIGIISGISYLPILVLLIMIGTSVAIPSQSLIKLPGFFITTIVPWDLIQLLSLFQDFRLDSSSMIVIFIIGFQLLILFIGSYIFIKKKELGIHLFLFFLTPLVISVISLSSIKIAALRSFIIFSPSFFFILAYTLVTIKKPRVIFFLFGIMGGLFLYSSILIGKNAEIIIPIKKDDIIIHNDVTSFAQSIITMSETKQFLMNPGHLKKDSYSAIGVSISSLETLPTTKRLWYIKQYTNWPPYDNFANRLEIDLRKKFRETLRIKGYKSERILYVNKKTQ